MENKNINCNQFIDCQYKDNQDGDALQNQVYDVKTNISPEQLLKIREALAEGIARSLVYNAVTELHKQES